MDHLLLVDQVGGLHHQVHQLVCVVTPCVKVFQGVLTKDGVSNRRGSRGANNSAINALSVQPVVL